MKNINIAFVCNHVSQTWLSITSELFNSVFVDRIVFHCCDPSIVVTPDLVWRPVTLGWFSGRHASSVSSVADFAAARQ